MRGPLSRAALLSLLTLSAANPETPVKRKAATKNTSSNVGKTLTPPHADAAGVQGYNRAECYDSNLNPFTQEKGSKDWIQINQTDVDFNSNSNPGQNNLNDKYEHTNWYYDIYDAYYNGTFSITLQAPEGTNSSVCQNVVSPIIPDMYFRIGQMSRSGGKYSRKDYDKNQYYFRFGRGVQEDYACGLTPKKLFSSFESSNSQLDTNQAWTLDVKKNEDGFDISGKVSTTVASYNNYFNYLTANSLNTADECPDHFQIYALTAQNNATMSGRVTEGVANLTWAFTDVVTKWSISGSFNGTAFKKGAKLVTSGSQPQTSGEAKRIVTGKDATKDDAKKVVKIAAGVVVGVVLLIALLIGALVFFFCRKRKQRTAYIGIDDDRDWGIDEDNKNLHSGATPMGYMDRKPSPSPVSQGLLLNQDTSYGGPHLPPAASPGLRPQNPSHPPLRF
ncbi:hypothetical protein E2P81_ATG08641 [Venturia nashicola]|nr:hypothetical protein E2P81_ATG08641 [Venturia nashicola]